MKTHNKSNDRKEERGEDTIKKTGKTIKKKGKKGRMKKTRIKPQKMKTRRRDEGKERGKNHEAKEGESKD